MNRVILLVCVIVASLCSHVAADEEAKSDAASAVRFVVFAPGAPLLIELQMTIDGEPFHLARARLVDQLLRQADVDKDGKPTWVEAMVNPRFAFGRFASQGRGLPRAPTGWTCPPPPTACLVAPLARQGHTESLNGGCPGR